MKKIYLEVLLVILFVSVSTFLVYGELASVSQFWNLQMLWSGVLALGWLVVSAGYFHQGSLVRAGHSITHISIFLPSAVFIVQCVLFIKGIYYHDWALIFGAIVVNSGVTFNLYQILKVKISRNSK